VTRRALPAVAALVLLCAACTGGDDAADAAADDTSSTTTTVLGAQELPGRYAHYDVVAYEGDGMKTLIISYGFTDYDVVDGEVVSTDSFCFSEHRSDQPIQVELSDTATRAIIPEPVAVSVTESDGRLRVQRPTTPTGIGVRLDDPAQDPLPTDPDDPRIVDDDGDGKPGVTATITAPGGVTGELYLARREIFAYTADRQDDGSLIGTVEDDSEQLVIGASNPVFMTQAQWVQHPDPAKSPILLVPVERSWDCDRLRAERDTIFPPTPEVDW
jgi:hypothetical protein